MRGQCRQIGGLDRQEMFTGWQEPINGSRHLALPCRQWDFRQEPRFDLHLEQDA
jgi:hypothetical protein